MLLGTTLVFSPRNGSRPVRLHTSCEEPARAELGSGREMENNQEPEETRGPRAIDHTLQYTRKIYTRIELGETRGPYIAH